jgi:hypothetical protein
MRKSRIQAAQRLVLEYESLEYNYSAWAITETVVWQAVSCMPRRFNEGAHLDLQLRTGMQTVMRGLNSFVWMRYIEIGSEEGILLQVQKWGQHWQIIPNVPALLIDEEA